MDVEDLRNMAINPIYAVVFSERFFDNHEPTVAKEDWVKNNVKLMKDIGEEAWLRALLTTLADTSKPTDKHAQVIDPYPVVAISERFNADHKPLIGVDQWVQANVAGFKEESQEEWLWRLLNVLETGGI